MKFQSQFNLPNLEDEHDWMNLIWIRLVACYDQKSTDFEFIDTFLDRAIDGFSKESALEYSMLSGKLTLDWIPVTYFDTYPILLSIHVNLACPFQIKYYFFSRFLNYFWLYQWVCQSPPTYPTLIFLKISLKISSQTWLISYSDFPVAPVKFNFIQLFCARFKFFVFFPKFSFSIHL